jgi:hypothetical protein
MNAARDGRPDTFSIMSSTRRVPSWFLALIVFVSVCGSVAAGCGSDDNPDAPLAGDASDSSDATLGDDGNPFQTADGSGGDGGANPCVAPTSLTISPSAPSATVSPGAPFSATFTVTASYAGQPDEDQTAASFFTASDANVGSFSGNVFTWSGAYGGVITITAQHCGVTASTTLTLKLSTVVGAGADGGIDAAGTANQFDTAPSSSAPACAPKLVYPADGVLFPPNMNVVQVHFDKGTPPNDRFEISFSNSVTDVRVFTTCTGASAGDGMTMNGGCVFELDQAEWNYVARTNRNGDPVTVKVRGLGCDGANVASSDTRQVSFAKEDLVGALYYWASMRITVNGTNFNSGGIYRYDFGVRGQLPDPVLTPSSGANPTHLCIGCHTVSRDGRQMIFDFDDNDSDDEYGDVNTDVFDIAAAKAATPIVKNSANAFAPGYHVWNRGTTQFLLSDGPGDTATPKGAFTRVSPSGSQLGFASLGADGGVRATTPDWAPDDSMVVFSVPPNVKSGAADVAGYWMAKAGPRDDLMFSGASLQTATWDPSTNAFGLPATLLASNGTDNYYYPSYSPDGSLLVFNHAPSGSNFHNPLARVEVVVAGQNGPTPVDLAKLNDDPTVQNGAAGRVTNSWPRWSPFVQAYKSGNILWLTMSSTRTYGLQIDNDGTQNCYPKESPNWVTPVFTDSPTPACTRTQLWMAAVKLDAAGVAGGTDVSYPAFWLPFQDLQTNNHLGQWSQKTFTGTCGTTDAGADAGTCAPGLCCENGGCTACAKPQGNATCAIDANCATGECCTAGTCGACSSSGDAGAASACSTCLDCNGQACVSGACGSCTNSAQCCAPLQCVSGACIPPIK